MKKLYITLTILSIIFLGIGGTLAAITYTANAVNITQIKSGNLTMTIDGGGNQSVSLFPSSCTSEHAIKRTITAKAVNTSGGKVSFSIGLNITALGDDLKRETMRYALSTSSDSCTKGLIAGGSFKDKQAGSDVWLIRNDYDNITRNGNNYTKTYYLYIWLDEIETEVVSGDISIQLKGTTSNNPNLAIDAGYSDSSATNTLYYKIKSNADNTTRIDFSKISTEDNTNGIYTTTSTENGVPVYYYRGAVNNNHVLFANLCWEIIRTTETGGVKLIYDGTPSNGTCTNTGASSYLPDNSEFNSSYDSPAYVGYMYGSVYTAKSKTMRSLSGNIIYGNDVTYDTETGEYTLVDTITKDVADWATDYTTIGSKYHYTCFTSSNTCTQVNYMHYSDSSSSYYFILTDGKKHTDILEEMLNNNTNESTAKKAIDLWYSSNMTSYTSQLEDITFCNDRSISSYGGWDKDTSNSSDLGDSDLLFGMFDKVEIDYELGLASLTSSLICSREIDKFTVNSDNGNGALTYPVGLITADEIVHAGGGLLDNNSFYLYTDERDMWSLSPSNFHYYYANEFALYSAGYFSSRNVNYASGLRPVVSLKPGTVVVEGNGSSNRPYVILTD